ncbi:MAG: DUF2157 domain-containing protein [Alphaproteobacteria bacterium]|nr:DUF2157 domain-containing protein [Alphaproteobacteria bacterium]
MTEKAQALHAIVAQMREAGLTPPDVARAWEETAAPQAPVKKPDFSEIAPRVFGWLGAAFVMAGVGVYTANFWDEMGAFGRVAVTLGVGFLLNVIAIVCIRDGRYSRAEMPLIFFSAIMQTSGWFVLIHELFPHGDNPQKAVAAVAAVMAAMQVGLYSSFKRTDLAFTTIFFAFAFLQAVLDLLGVHERYVAFLLGGALIVAGSWLARTPHAVLAIAAYAFGALWFNLGLFEIIRRVTNEGWAGLLAGMSVMSFGWAMTQGGDRRLTGLAYFFGSILFFAGLFDLVEGTAFELLYFGAAIGMVYVCTVLRSKAILFTSICALLGYIGYFTAQHFANSLGWPLALVLMGLGFFGVGMMAVKVKKKYLA